MASLFQRAAEAFHVYNRMRKTAGNAESFGFNRRLAWREMRINHQTRKKYPVRIIALGFDCLVRTVLTNWMLKPDRRCGEKGMLFDRTKHSAKVIADFLEKDFSGYFDDWRFNPAPELHCWFNCSLRSRDAELQTNFLKARSDEESVFYYHDYDCGPDDLEKLKARTRGRLDRFLDTLTHPRTNDLYILNKRLGEDPADMERVCRLLREKRGSVPTHILVLVTESEDPVQKIEGATLIRCIYPYKDTFWGDHNRHRRLHVFFGMKIARACREYIRKSFPSGSDAPSSSR